MKYIISLLFFMIASHLWAAEDDLTKIPIDKGLPVQVRAAFYFLDILSFDENEGVFEATTDMRLTWTDLRLQYPKAEGINGYKEFRASKAEAELEKIWLPPIRVANQDGDPSFMERRLRLYPDGTVETITRVTARYKTAIDVDKFPFDTQHLTINLRVREETNEYVTLNYSQNDVSFSKPSSTLSVEGFIPQLVHLKKQVIKGWNGDRYAAIDATLTIAREPSSVMAQIFIPLLASLLIPLLVLWMNRIENGEFAVDAIELANVIIGGLFSAIALGFTLNADFKTVAAGNNTVTQLFALNYLALAISLLITIFIYRFNLPKRLFNRFVQEAFFDVITWAMPTLVFGSAIAFMLAAAT